MSIPQPQVALVFHGENENKISCVTRHEVDREAGLKLGDYIDLDECITLMQNQLSPENQRQKQAPQLALLPKNILLDNNKYLIWYKPAHAGLFWYRSANSKFNLSVNYPAMLFVVKKKNAQLSVFALPSNQRPTIETFLYHAPIMNVYSNGIMCQGSAVLPSYKETTEGYLEAVESTVFHSYFTHVNHDATLKSKGAVSTPAQIAYWKRKSKSKAKVKMNELNRYMRFGQYLSELL